MASAGSTYLCAVVLRVSCSSCSRRAVSRNSTSALGSRAVRPCRRASARADCGVRPPAPQSAGTPIPYRSSSLFRTDVALFRYYYVSPTHRTYSIHRTARLSVASRAPHRLSRLSASRARTVHRGSTDRQRRPHGTRARPRWRSPPGREIPQSQFTLRRRHPRLRDTSRRLAHCLLRPPRAHVAAHTPLATPPPPALATPHTPRRALLLATCITAITPHRATSHA